VAALDAFEKNERAQQAIEAAFELDPSDPAKFRQQVEGLAEHDIFFTTSEVLEFVTEGTAEGVKRFEARNRGRSNMDSGQTFLDRALIDEALAGGEAGQQALTLIQSEILHEVVGRELIMRAPQVTGQIIGFGEQAVLNRQFNRFPAIGERLGARRGLTLKEVRGDAF
jgi:hypothetical protein